MKKGIIGLMTACMLFNLAVVGHSQKVEAAGETYVKVNEETLSTGTYLVVIESGKLMGAYASKIAAIDVAITNNMIEYSDGYTLWEISNEGTYWTLCNGTTYLGYDSSTNFQSNTSVASDKFKWTISNDGNGNYAVINKASTNRQIIYQDSGDRFAPYSTTNATANGYNSKINFYKLDGETGGDVEDPVEKTPTEEVNELLSSYYNNGNYLRHTEINLNETAKNELAKYWHAGSDLLERDTYFVGEELWMTNEKGTYSYYGTDGADMISARTENPLYQPKSTHVAIKGKTMEQYYTTMDDIKNNTAEWTKNGNVYSTNDKTVVEMFLDFTAPCLYDVTEENNNYLSYNGVEVEETSEGLVLRLKATTLETGKLATENGVLSTATITKQSNSVTITNVADALKAASGTPLCLEGTVVSYYTSGTNSFILEDNTDSQIVVYSPNIAVNLNDTVSVTGDKAIYNSTHQVGSSPNVNIIEESGFEPTVTKITLEKAVEIATGLDTNIITQDKYTISGTVTIENSKYYVTDGTNRVQLFNGTLDGLHQDCGITVTGNLTRYNTTSEIVNYEIDEIINCKYTVTIPTFENGSVTANQTTEVEYGTTVTFTVTPASGYKIEYAGIGSENKVTDTEGETTFEYIVKGDITVFASFILRDQEVQLTEKQAALDLSVASNRTSFSTDEQVWSANGVVVTNAKGSSSSNVADYTPPRFYKSSKVKVEMSEGNAINKIVFTCNGSSYATALVNSISDSNATATASGSTVTVTFKEAVSSFEVVLSGGQVRMGNSIVVYYMG